MPPDVDQWAEMIADVVEAAVSPLVDRIAFLERRELVHGRDGRDAINGRDGKDGKDGVSVDVAVVKAMVADAVAALPKPRDGIDGKDGQPVDVATLTNVIAGEVDRAVKALPAPKDGKDGTSVEPVAVEVMVAKAVEALPRPRDGKDGASVDLAAVEALVTKAVAAIPVPKDGKDGRDGKDVVAADLEPLIVTHVERAIALLPVAKDGKDGKDGLGITNAVINRDGHLVLMFADGTTRDVGLVAGRDGDPEQMKHLVIDAVQKAVEAIPRPKDGRDGKDGKDGVDAVLSNLRPEFDGDRTLRLYRLDTGELWHEMKFAVVLYRGIWETTRPYEQGDQVTHKGSQWIARADIAEDVEPGDGATAWVLSAKRGGDGKPGTRGPVGPEGKQGPPGRDLTQLDPETGRKW